ncbi:MAG TPA: PAS domain-containing protein [Gemmatimonadaceae bacterium]|nr:PAS domain-containing protein [Gemmatimonadaceae bacterium]
MGNARVMVDPTSDAARLFAGAGEMRARCRTLDWGATPLGPAVSWPQSLRTAAGTALASGFPTVLLWGPELIQLYNDGYVPFLGVKHPWGLGLPTRVCSPESWEFNEPVYRRVLAGETVTFEDQLHRLARRGPDAPPDDVYITLSYAPVPDETGGVGGVFITLFETTAQVAGRTAETERGRLAGALASARERMLEDVFRHTPSFLAVLRGPENVFELANDAYYQLIGRGRDVIGKPMLEALPEVGGQGFEELMARVRDGGERLVLRDIAVRLERVRGAPLEERFLDLTYLPLDEGGGAGRPAAERALIAHGMDVTERVHARRAVEALLAESDEARRDLEAANEQLQAQQLELELTNQQLQDQAGELEVQAEELQATADSLARSAQARDQALAALQATERWLRLALDAARMVAWEWNPAREQITTSKSLRDIYGVEAIESAAEGFARVHPEDRQRHQAAVETAVREARAYYSEFRFIRPDNGETVWIEERGLPVLDGEGRVEKIVGVIIDVSARKRAELDVAGHEHQLRTLVDAIPTLAWTARADGYIEWYNARWYEYTGTTPEQMAGWGWQSIHDPAVLPQVLERWRASIATGKPFEMTFPLRGADGRFRPFLTRVSPITDAGGQVVRWFGTNTDVTAERAARQAAEVANQAKTDFLATMSHELRTPLNAIAGYAELLELGIHGPVTDQQREAISRIQRSQRHLLGLINDVLNFAKLEAGHVEYRLADVPVRTALDALEPLVAPQLRAKSLRFHREGQGDECTVRADPDKLQQILVNLLSNAIKFTPAGGAVTLRCRTDGGTVAIAIQDTGIGIAADRLEHVFAPFVQIDRRLNAPHEGTGLGLAISRDLARGMGGELTVESTPGLGSTFTLTLPRADAGR